MAKEKPRMLVFICGKYVGKQLKFVVVKMCGINILQEKIIFYDCWIQLKQVLISRW